MENEQGGGHFLRKQLAACRATELQDYRDAKVNVAHADHHVQRVAEQGWYRLKRPRGWWHGCGAVVEEYQGRELRYGLPPTRLCVLEVNLASFLAYISPR